MDAVFSTLPLGTMWLSTRKEFLDGRYTVDVQDFLPRLSGEVRQTGLDDMAKTFFTTTLYGMPDADGFAVVQRRSPEDPRQCALLARTADGWERIGALDGWGLYVNENYRGMGLGGRLAYAGMALSGETTTDYGLYSSSGYAAFAVAHRLSVQAALKAGANVPAKVLADYPDLGRDAESSPGNPTFKA